MKNCNLILLLSGLYHLGQASKARNVRVVERNEADKYLERRTDILPKILQPTGGAGGAVGGGGGAGGAVALQTLVLTITLTPGAGSPGQAITTTANVAGGGAQTGISGQPLRGSGGNTFPTFVNSRASGIIPTSGAGGGAGNGGGQLAPTSINQSLQPGSGARPTAVPPQQQQPGGTGNLKLAGILQTGGPPPPIDTVGVPQPAAQSGNSSVVDSAILNTPKILQGGASPTDGAGGGNGNGNGTRIINGAASVRPGRFAGGMVFLCGLAAILS